MARQSPNLGQAEKLLLSPNALDPGAHLPYSHTPKRGINHTSYIYDIKATAFGDQKARYRTSQAAQWLRILLPIKGTWVRALVREDPTCRGATKPVRCNY